MRYCYGCGQRLEDEPPYILCDGCAEKPPKDIAAIEKRWKQKADLLVSFPVWWDSPEFYKWLTGREVQLVYMLREGIYIAEVDGVPIQFEKQDDGTWLYSGVGWGRYTSMKLPVGVLSKMELNGQCNLF